MIKKQKPDIAKWKPTKKQIFCEPDGKIILVYFDKIFGKPGTDEETLKKLRSYSEFSINKTAIHGMIDTITHYINYFMNKYDPEDELATAYLRMKHIIERNKCFKKKVELELDTDGKPIYDPEKDEEGNEIIDEKTGEPKMVPRYTETMVYEDRYSTIEDLPEIVNHIYRTVFTESICEKIRKVVADNYSEEVESANSSYRKSDKKYLEDLEFTNEHMIIMHRISYAMKIMAPVIFHYLAYQSIKLRAEEYHLYNAYAPLLTLFSDGIDMYNKLYIYIRAKVNVEAKYNSPIYNQREILGCDVKTVTDRFLRIKLITDIMIKYQLDGNILGLNKGVMKQQLSYFLRIQYQQTLVELSTEKDEEGLSGADKMEMHIPKIDEGAVIYTKENIRTAIQLLKEQNRITITDEELAFYKKNHRPSDLQMELVRAHYAKLFVQSRDLDFVGDEYYYMALLLKKQLLMDSGYNPNESPVPKNIYLPYILTGKQMGMTKSKQIRKASFLDKIYKSYPFIELKRKYRSLCEIYPNYFEELISKLIYGKFHYLCYEDSELTGTEIEYDDDIMSSEILTFLHADI